MMTRDAVAPAEMFLQAADDAGVRRERLHVLRAGELKPGRRVIYWMQAAQRETANHALETALALARRQGLPLLVFFGLTPSFPEANRRSYAFMLDGLAEVKAALARRGIGLVLRCGDPVDELAELAGTDTAAVIVDGGYTRVQREWRVRAAGALACPLTEVETEVAVPVGVASDHEEYMARTIRPKLLCRYHEFIALPRRQPVEIATVAEAAARSLPFERPDELLDTLPVDRRVDAVPEWRGGYDAAAARLRRFLATGLARYDERNDPNGRGGSRLSPYLHFGQIFTGEIIAAAESAAGEEGTADFVEELLVRRELAINYVWFNRDYDTPAALPQWARETLARHRGDPRGYVYHRDELERAATHDEVWNAAQREMVRTGHMAGYLRMYWGKKILEWLPDPAEAWRTALYLNNKYELDGRDPNAYAGVAWCFGKHDRPWPEHPVFGTVRTMTRRGMAKKFDLAAYIARFPA